MSEDLLFSTHKSDQILRDGARPARGKDIE